MTCGYTNDTNSGLLLSNALYSDISNYPSQKSSALSRSGFNTKGINGANYGTQIGFDNTLLRNVSDNSKSGDITWCAFNTPGNTEFLSGHTGVIYNDPLRGEKIIFSSASFGALDSKDYQVNWYSLSSHVQNNVKSGKLMGVTGKSESEGKARVENIDNRYHGTPFFMPLMKIVTWPGMYCSQLSWFVWHEAYYPNLNSPDRVDIDGSPWPQGTWVFVNSISYAPVWVKIGWFTILIWVPVVIVICYLINIDMVEPWDIVISDKTKEVLWWGPYHDHP